MVALCPPSVSNIDRCCRRTLVEQSKRALRRLSSISLVLLFVMSALGSPAGAQYGGVSGLFVTSSPMRPGVADFSGLGCQGGEEVVLYFPGIQATNADPAANQTVPGRILAVTTAVSSPDALINGTFSFANVVLPTDVEPGVYEVHARCGTLDLRVLIQIDGDGQITIDTDPNAPIVNETNETGVPNALPFTGRDSSGIVSLAAGLIAAGIAFLALSRRRTTSA